MLAVPGARAAETHMVFMTALRFCNAPACAASEDTTIKKGDTVQWIFSDPACVALHAVGCFHTTTSGPGSSKNWNSGAMPGTTALGLPSPKLMHDVTFNATGNFPYVCSVHAGSGMKATIHVTN